MPTVKPPRKASVEARADEVGVDPRTIRRQIDAGALRAIKIGTRLIITDRDWTTFLASRPVAGGGR